MEVCVCFGGEERCPKEGGGGERGDPPLTTQATGLKGKTRYLDLNYYKQFTEYFASPIITKQSYQILNYPMIYVHHSKKKLNN